LVDDRTPIPFVIELALSTPKRPVMDVSLRAPLIISRHGSEVRLTPQWDPEAMQSTQWPVAWQPRGGDERDEIQLHIVFEFLRE
jgi:hypothetical protein